MSNDAQIFHVEIVGRYGLFLILVFAPVFWFASSSWQTLSVAAVFLALAAISTPVLFTVTVGPDGIVLYRVNRARWQDFEEAKQISFLGLPYLSVQRRKGTRWWIPLYLSKPDEFRLAVHRFAPHGNPLREYAERSL